MNIPSIEAATFEEAFKTSIKEIWNNPDYICGSRLGPQREVQGFNYVVFDPSTFEFEDKSIGRIQYPYASDFYDFMISGSTDAEEAFKEYPNVAQFVTKPKSSELPDNFNTFYGPRIVAQLPFITKELTDNPDSRRAVISILSPQDLELLDKDETLEFPCCDSATFSIREGHLNLHLHMRSQNMGQVLKLDMYLWGRFHTYFAEVLKVDLGLFTSSIVSAHVFEKDEEYLRSLNII